MKEIMAKQILSHGKNADSYFGIRYNMNIYRGCQHGCIYCDSMSECYQIKDFRDIQVKVNAVELLAKELCSKREKGTVGFGSMSDPYIPLEKKYKLTSRALQVIRDMGYPAHLITKSDMVVRDKKVLSDINKVYAAVSFTITTTDDDLAKIIEPYAPLPSARFKAMKELSDEGIYTGVTMMPILPFIEDSRENIEKIIKTTAQCGGKYILPFVGMTLRDRQRVYYYEKLDENFQGLRSRYEKIFGNNYECNSPKAKELYKCIKELTNKYGISLRMEKYEDRLPKQISFFD